MRDLKRLQRISVYLRSMAVFAVFIFIFGSSVSVVRADVTCTAMNDVSSGAFEVSAIDLSAGYLVWSTATDIMLYDIAGDALDTVAASTTTTYLDTEGDYIVWLDGNKIMLHTISADSTIQIGKGKRPIIKGNYVLYVRPHASGLQRLMLHDITAGTKRGIGLIKPDRFDFHTYDMDGGRVVYTDGTNVMLYAISSGLSRRLAQHLDIDMVQMDGIRVAYIALVDKPSLLPQTSTIQEVFVYNLSTDRKKRLTDTKFRETLLRVWIERKIVVWTERIGLPADNFILTHEFGTGLRTNWTTDYFYYGDIEQMEIGSTYFGTIAPDNTPVQAILAALYDRATTSVQVVQPGAYNRGHSMQLEGDLTAWVSENVTYDSFPDEYTVSSSTVFLGEGCTTASPPLSYDMRGQ